MYSKNKKIKANFLNKNILDSILHHQVELVSFGTTIKKHITTDKNRNDLDWYYYSMYYFLGVSRFQIVHCAHINYLISNLREYEFLN